MHDPRLNQKLGPYRLEKVVGRGGMGTVYSAVEETSNETAAIKVLSPGLAADPGFRERFAAEIESLKKLQHPNIVQLFGYGEQDGQLFYVMELIEGSSLQEELRRGRRFSWREVSSMTIEICAALKHAHDHGIIHRDLKPANLLLTTDEQIKLFDFGIAKLFGVSEITTGSVMGTADYMSPEQAAGRPVGPRSDLYSLGSVMYALLAGRPPFVGKNVAEVVHKVRFDAALPVTRVVEDIPVEMELLIEQLLEKEPSKRVPTALAVSHRVRALEHALSIHPDDQDSIHELDTADIPVIKDSSETTHRPTVAYSSQEKESASIHVGEEPEPDGSKPNHFTRVGQADVATSPAWPWTTALGVVAIVCLIVASVFAYQHWNQPNTADQLYDQIIAGLEARDTRSLTDVKAEIDEFLERFDQDPRIAEITEFKRDLQVSQWQRQLDAKIRRRDARLTPVEQLYASAMSHATHEPERAAKELEALIETYGDPESPSKLQQVIDVARLQRNRLDQELRETSKQHLLLIQERLAQADRLQTDDPQRAREMYEGIISLYSARPWANEVVDQARAQLENLP